MKKSYILIALAIIAALSMVSCGNNKKSQNQEPTQEDVQEMKQALADTVLAKIDEIAAQFFNASHEKFSFRSRILTDKEKAVKPDYLLEPSEMNNFVTKSQKINALAMLLMDLGVRYLYEMPVEESKEVIAKLALEVNLTDELLSGSENQQDFTEEYRRMYNNCKENNELPAFWQFYYANSVEARYILAKNPDLFFSKVTENEWQAYIKRIISILDAVEELSKYDEEMATIQEFINKTRIIESKEEIAKVSASKEYARQHFIDNKDKYITKRNALLQ